MNGAIRPTAHDQLPQQQPGDADDQRRRQRRAGRAATAGADRPAVGHAGSTRASVAAARPRAAAQRPADLGDRRRRSPATGGSRRRRAPAGRRRSTSVIRPGPRRHHHDPVGQEHRLGDRVRDEDRAGAGAARRSAAARPAAARGSSRRARRTARPSAAAAGARPAPARSPPAAACRRTAGPGSARRSRASPTSVEHLLRPAPGARARPAPRSSSGSSTLRCTVRHSKRPACWNAMPYSWSSRAWPGRLAGDRRPCRRSARSGRRSAAAACSCRSRTGRSARRTGRRSTVRSTSDSAVTSSGRPGVEDLGDTARASTARSHASPPDTRASVPHERQFQQADQRGDGEAEQRRAEHRGVDLRRDRWWPPGSTR